MEMASTGLNAYLIQFRNPLGELTALVRPLADEEGVPFRDQQLIIKRCANKVYFT